jgi:FMN reductase
VEDQSEMSTASIVGVSGSLSPRSRTRVIVEAILREAAEAHPARVTLVDIAEIAADLAASRGRTELRGAAEGAIRAVETADVLVVGTPVYRGTYAGLFKHLFDLVDQYALAEVPVILSATGGSERHALVIDQEMRPLFSFFGAFTVPIGVYATEADFRDYELTAQPVRERIHAAAHQAVRLLGRQALAA